MRYLLLLGLAAFSAVSALEKDNPCQCPMIWKPVCGTDGVTYPNECILKCVKLALEPALEVAHQGACKHVQQAAQEEEVQGSELEVAHKGPCYKQVLQAAQEEVVQSSEEPCVCPFIWKPVCGTDGQTYPNECTLKCVKLVLEPGLEVAHQGACKHRLLAAQEEEVQRSEKSCACPIIWEPVCGNDGLTYPSECILNCVKLKLKPELEVAHKGACYKHALQAAQQEEVQRSEEPCVCPFIWKPVCGTDGQTYPNECTLKCVKLVLEPGLEVAHQGACKHRLLAAQEEDVQRSDENEEFKQEVEKFVKDPCICPKIWRPVCGSDVRTYANECTLNCARSRDDPKLWLVIRTLCEYIPLEEQRKSKCACNTHNLPVCGNDGKTYRNPCELYCSAIFKKSGLDLAEYGPCTNDQGKGPN